MSKPFLLLLCVLFCLTTQQTLKPILLLPTETTQNVAVDYAFTFSTDTNIPHSGSIALAFPFEYDPRELIRYTGCFFAFGSGVLQQKPCILNLRTFTISIGQIDSGQLTILIKNIKNPVEASMSSQFNVKTMFRDVTITENLEFGKLPFTKASIITASNGLVYNYENNLIEQGSTWVFRFTLAGSYAQNSTIRFVFPDGFSSNKVQCNITGIIDSTLQTRVFPQRNIFDCLNIKASLSGYQNIILSGVVNPKYQMQMQGLQVQIVQPNNLVVLEKISITNQPQIKAKSMNATVTIPNNFRNNSITYTFEINMDSTLEAGDYVELSFAGNWTFFLQDSRIIEGVQSNSTNKARLEGVYNWPTFSKVFIRNFSTISKESQLAFYLSLKTPIQNAFYNLTITAFRQNGKVVEFYTRNIEINQTTGYIREMKLHPMNQAVKLPVNQTGPLEITLALRNNLPKTNVLTHGKIVIDITPHIPYPNVAINGVHKCYFYGNIPAKNCTYNVDTTVNPTVTNIVAFTPVDFNFQSSEIPFMVTTEGFQTDDDEGLTIDSLVKRYHFHIQFYTDYSPTIPTEVIFTEWVADAIPLTSLACNEAAVQGEEWNHLKCTFTTPNQVLNNDSHIHIIRFEFTNSGWYPSLGYTAQTLYPDYPCLVYGPNIISTPYPKCDLYTYTSNPAYKSDAGVSYINVYGIETIPANSAITFEFPKLKRINWNNPTSLNFSILEDTYGYETHYIGLYSQQLNLQSSSYIGITPFGYTSTGVTVLNTNSVVNKVGDITLSNIDLGVSGCDYVIFEVDQGSFPDIGRAQMFTCGSHKCSKFNKPIQYFILYPQTTLARYQNLVFPSILNPSKAGVYTFYLRAYKGYNMQKKISFGVTVTPDTLVAPTYTFASYETATQIYPNTKRFYKVSWTLKNKLAEQTSYIEVTFDNFFTLSSTYCDLTTTAQSWDGKGVECEVWQGSAKVLIQNMKETAVGQTFTLIVQMTTTSGAASISPTVTVITYVNGGSKVDQYLSASFTPATVTNTNLQTLTTFDFSKAYEFLKPIKKGYFGDLIVYYDTGLSQSSANTGTTLVLTFTPEFYPYSNVVNLPLSCRINGVRYVCSYTLNPFEVTITGLTSGSLNAGNSSVVNITTTYLERNGIYFPQNQGRYLFKAQFKNSGGTVIENSEQFIDIKPDRIQYFNMSYAHREANQDNIYIAEFQNGPTQINAYNDATNASRIYIGFPRVNADGSGTVFTSDLGFSNGTVVPCYFDTGADFATPISGKKMECRLRRSAFTSVPTYVEIINFDAIGPFKKIRVFMAKIRSPTTKIMDMNFNLKINYYNPSTYQEQPQYENDFNLFIDMLDASISTPTNADKTSQMFEPGAKVGDLNKYINHIPYSASSGYSQNDWFIVVMNSEFQLNGVVNNCIYNFYKRCIVFKEINWVAIHINNGTLIPFYPQITQLPLSISRVDTYYVCYSWKSERWAETITYTISASDRWMELRGAITNFNFKVLGSQNKLNINQKNVDVMVSFTVSHKVPAKGTIQIQFPNNSTKVPSIKPHCRSAVSMGSQLNGMKTGKPATNKQGQVGCLVQNTYSWLITSYEELPANSQVMISGVIDFPTVLTSTLGTGYVVTYTDEHATNVFANGRIIDYISTSFPLQVENKTWNVVKETTLTRSQPLRVNHIGKFEFKLQMQDYIRQLDTWYTGYVDVNFWRYTILGDAGGFGMPSGSSVCSVIHETTKEKFACLVDSVTQAANYITYRLKFYYILTANTPYLVTISTQKGDSNEGISWPSTVGTYKIETQIMYYTNYSTPYPPQVSKAQFIEVYGPKFNALNLVSSVSIPGETNLLLFEIVPSSNITNNYHRIAIEIPTISNDNVNLFDQDLGMGYKNNDDLVFDLYDSSIASMKCKVYLGDRVNNQPTRVICNQYNVNNITTSNVVRFGFWVKNPNTTQALAIPIQVYVEETNNYRKLQWQMLEAGVKVIPTSVSPINDYGNFYSDTPYRQVKDTKFRFTNRNTKPLQAGDYYILKFNFDLRKSDKQTSAFKYPYSSYTNTGDAIFLRNCQTILLKVGATALANFVAADAAQSNKLNVLLDNVIYNPATKLSTTESTITAYAVYMATEECEKIIHKDAFPTLAPYEPTTPDFTMTAINSNLRKGQYEDYKFTFRMNNDILTDASLVKKISIQFPADTVYDFKFRGKSCIEDPSTTIQIKKCTIDTTTYTIWIDPVVKTTYINSNYVIFQTIGKSVINPVSKLSGSDRMYLNNFVIKYYTWANDDNPPAIFANSDDYCFMKQDSTQLSSTAYLTYTSTTVGHHDFADITQEVYVNEFLPLSTDIGSSINRVKVPLSFKFIAPTAFANKDGTGSYHLIKVNYGTVYTVPTQTRTNDLYRLIPTCELNGYRILNCNIDTVNNEVSMNFQQAIAAGEQVSVRFSVLDPADSASDGFITSSTSSPLLTLPVYITPSGGTNYYIEPEPFPTYYKSSGITYPSMGISKATVAIGTQVFGKMNYLDFVIQFSRSDVNGLILEIPLVELDGSIVYSNSKLLGLQSGAQYPCSVGHGMNVFCFYERGQTKTYGKPTRIYISRWLMPASNTLSFRMLFTNPDVINVFPTFTFKAYGGTISNSKFMGDEFMGEFSILNAFKTMPATPTYFGTPSCNFYPTRRLYSTSTNVQFYINNDITTGGYVMLQWPLHDTSYGQVSEYQVYNNTYDYDYFIVNYARNNRKLYIVKKITAFWNGATDIYGNIISHHDFGYLRNKHFLVNTATIYYFETPYLNQYSCTVDHTWHNSNRDANQFAIGIQYLDLQDRTSGGWGWQFLSIDMSSSNPSSFNSWLNSTDLGDMIVVVKWVANLPFSALSSTPNDCSLEDGLRNTNLLKPITCTIDTTKNEIVFRNVNKLSGRYLKFYYYAQTLGSNTWNHQVQMRVYANSDSYANTSWQIWSDTTPAYTMPGIELAVDGGYSSNMTTGAEAYSWTPEYIWNHDYDSGSVKITALSSSSITIAATKATYNFYETDVYKMSFRFYMPRLTFTGGCSVSSSSGLPRSDGSCSVSANRLTVNYSFYDTSDNNYHDWPTWYAGTTYTWTISVSISGQLNADYMFVTMAYSYFVSTYYWRSSQCGTPGCACNQCPESQTLTGAASTYCSSTCGAYDYLGYYYTYCCGTSYYSNRYCRYWNCRWYWKYGGQVMSGKGNTPYSSTSSFVSSYSGDLISYQKSVETELMLHFSNFQKAVGPSQQSFIMAQFQSISVANNNPFPYTSNSEYAAEIDCKCLVASTGGISISYSTTYQTPKCYRYLPSLTDSTMDPSIGISIDVAVGQDLRCFFPGFVTTSSSTHNIDIFLQQHNYIHTDMPRKYWARYSQYDSINVGMNTYNIPYGISFDDYQDYYWENNFWSGGETSSSRYYELNFSMSYNQAYPEVYMSMYAPVPVYEFCTTTSWSFCRVYDSFINRKYFFVAKSTSSSISSFRIAGTSSYPTSFDASSSFYNTLLYVTQPAYSRYLFGYSNARTSSPNLASVIYPQTNTKAIQTAKFGSFLETYNSSLMVSVYLPGRKIYSVSRNYGQYQGSFVKVTFSGLTNLKGCGATLQNRPINMDAPLFCQVISNSEINIFSRIDLTITDYIYFTVYTAGLPASSTYTVEVFNKYISSSNYARSFAVSGTYCRSRGGYSTMDPTQIQWRRPAYKELMTTSGPVRFKFRNNLQYVSDYSQSTFAQTTNTNAIVVSMPSGFSSSDTYICYARQYLPGKQSLYRKFQVPCGYWSYGGGNKVHIKPLPAYILKPAYYYEFVVYRHSNTSTMLITLPTADVYSMQVITTSVTNSESVAFYDYFDFYKYKNVYPCVLNSIYTLTRQAAANNSLYIDFTLNINGTSFNYFEFEISALGLSSFKIDNGEEIPCYLSAEFATVGGKTQAPRCFGYTNAIGADSPLVIRVFGFGSWTSLSGTNFKLAFDNFNNPAVQKLFLVPIDVTFRYIDRQNRRRYQSSWPSVYLSDSINMGSPTEISGSLSRNNDYRGQNSIHYISVGWPYSSSSDTSQKVVLKLAGGVLCCQPFSSINLRDNYNSYTLLWRDTKANMSVYLTPSYNAGWGRDLWINSVNNPYPYQRDTYQQLKKIQILFYSNWNTVYSKKLDQFDYSTYWRYDQMTINASPSLIDSTKSYYFHQEYPITYRFYFSTSRNEFNNRQLSYTIVTFTSGVSGIQWVHAGWNVSPYYFNSMLQVTIGKNANGKYYLNISGMSDAAYSSSYNWYFEMRFFTTSDTISYTSQTYCLNGELEFTNSRTLTIPSTNFQTAPYAPTAFELREKKYFKNYFELQRIPVYAKPSASVSKLQFRFKTPYTIINQETIDIVLPDTTELYPINSPSTIYCLIRKTITTNLETGISRWAACTYSSGKYRVTNPIGDLLADTEYTLTILQRNQTTSSFKIPYSPKRSEVSLIYTSQLNLLYGDVYDLDFAGRMNSISWTHASVAANQRNMIGINFNPQFTLSAASLTSPVTETMLELEIYSKEFDACIGAASIFNTDNAYFASGTYYSHFSNPAVANANTRLKCGQYSQSFAPIKLTTTDYGQVSANTGYYFRYPLILNPGDNFIPYLYNFRLLQYQTDTYYPVVVASYEYEGLDYTVFGNVYGETGYVSASNNWVQSTMTLTYTWPNFNQGAGSETWLKWKNNQIQALTDISSLKTITTSNYNYQYYPNINLCVYIKTNNIDTRTVALGSYPTNDDIRAFKVSWINIVYGNKYDREQETNLAYWTNDKTGWDTSSFTLVSGLKSTNSEGIFRVTWMSSSLKFVQGTYMKVTFQNSAFNIMDEYCLKMSGFYQGTTSTASNLICRRSGSTELTIEGYQTINTGTTLSFDVYLKVATNSVGTYTTARAYIQVFSQDDKAIIQAVTSNLASYSISQGAENLKLQNAMRYKFLKDTARELYVQFKLATNTLGMSQYVQIDFGDWVLDTSATGKVIASYKVGSNYYYTPCVFTKVSGNKYRFGVYKNISTYSMTANQLITLRIDHINPDNFYGILVPNTKWNYIKIIAYTSAGVALEHQFAEIWVEPYEHLSFDVQPALDYVNAVSIYEFTVTPNVSVTAGDYIQIEFTTGDGLYSDLFSNNLGKTIPTNDSLELSCRQTNNAMIISNSNIKCELFKGDITTSPTIPTTIQIKVEKNIAANQLISFNILSLKNPNRANYPIGITFKLGNICYQKDSNRLCNYYKSTKYMTFKTAASVPLTTSNFGTLSFLPNIVSATNSKHTFGAPMALTVGDFVKIVYYPEVTVKDTCSLQGSVGVCYSYSLENTIIIKATAAQSSPFSFTLNGMTNLYQYSGNTLYTEVWQASTKTITKIFTTSYTVPIITSDPTSGNPLAITFEPTLTPNYQLSYNFANIAKIKISYLLQNSNVQQILLTAPGGITLNSKYCNATLESGSTEAKPYPFRYKCEVISSSQVRITQNSDFPAWTPAFINKKVVVYLMYTISLSLLGQSCSNWVATTFTNPTAVATNLRVSEAVGNFYVQLYQSPYIYKVDFFTYSFTKRICQTGEQCMFYGYLLPTTSQAAFQIKYMDYTIPSEFKYSNLLSYNGCDMKQKNSDNDIFKCTATRNNSKVTIRFMPDVSYTYNHNYKLLKIDNVDATKLFTAPQYPGTHYQMKVDLYTNLDKLIESQYINLTTVYGKLLSWNDINIKIPQDADTTGVFEFTFKVGASDVQPAYESSSTNRITSAIEVIFSNSFSYDLGTGKKTGQEVACLPILNLNLNTMGKLTCKIYPSTSTITNPTIIVTGYDKILSGQLVTFMVAGLKSLPNNITDYIKIGVSYKYYDYGNVKGYLYEPTGKVVGPVTPKNAAKTITVTVNETSSNIVGQLVNYYFNCTFTVGFSPVTVNDYVGIEFPQYGFEGRFSLNPKAKCSPAASEKCYSFGLANVIYFKPSTPISATTLSFSLRDTINSAFAFDYKSMAIKIFTVIGGKIDSVGTGTLVKLSKPSLNISGLVTKSDSIYGGESGISYYADFKLGTYLPEYGKVSITFPNVYSSLFDLYASCSFTDDTLKKMSDLSFCSVVSTNQLIIAPNGILLDKDSTYSIIIYNITNPNANITLNKFTIQSFYSSDIYNKQIISQNTFSPPEINVLLVKTCQFDLTVETKNQNYKSFYSMALICPSVIKEASRLQVYLPWNLTDSGKQLCTSQSNSLYSYECSIKNEYINNKLTSFMEIYLREHVPQKLISLKGSITNGIKGSYTLNASVSYKGFTYLVGTSNKIYLEDTNVKQLTKMEILIQNYPYNRNYQSLYTFKITNPKISANSLRIDVPSVITQGPNGITCDSELSSTNKDYFMFLTLKNATSLICSMDGQSILITGLISVINSLKDDEFLFLDVFGLKNPDVSVDKSEFKFTFLNITDSTGSVIGSIVQNLPYKVSEAPLNMQMNTISLSSQKFEVINNYTFISSTIAGTLINITAKSEIGVKVLFPQEYAKVWNITSQPSNIKIYLGNTLYTATNINMVSRILMARFSVDAFVSFSQVKVMFEFRNPSDQINCTASNFVVSLFDFKQNSIVAETVGNNVACLQFSDKLFWIKVSGNSEIRSGNFSVYTIELQKPAKYLKITPRTTTSAIIFSPASITFSDYSSTIQQFKIVSSPAFVGSFLVTFDKEQLVGDLFYNDIKNETVTLVAPIAPYMINFEENSVKSVGDSIDSYISIQVPSTIAFALLHTNNCSSNYEITPVGRITVPAGSSQVSFSIKYKGDVIPYMCAIKFEISSLTNINYALATNVLYLSGEPSIDRTNSLRPMILKITKAPRDSKDVGTSILTSDTKSTLKPTVYELKDKTIKANWVEMEITTSQPGFIYYAAMETGTEQDKVTQKMIFEQNIKTGLVYNKTRAVISSVGSVNIITSLMLTGLQSDKRYLIGAYVNSTVGVSDIKFKQVQTLKSSNGAVIKICFNAIQDNSTVLATVSTVLRIKPDRLSVFTFKQILQDASTSYSNSVMNSRRYVYELVLAPNRLDDSISPMDSFNDLMTSKDLQNKIKASISSFDLTYTMTAHELILAKPKIRGNGITVERLTYQNVRVSVQFWQVAYVYGVIVQADSTKPALQTKQIIDGMNRQNVRVNATHRVSTQTDDSGIATLEFRLLSEKTDYEIFVTAECVLPYNPRAQLLDSQVLKQSIKTSTNLNVANNGDKIIEQLKQIKNDNLAQAVKEHLLSVEQKKVLNEKVTKIRKRK